jgi:hypothetical protein
MAETTQRISIFRRYDEPEDDYGFYDFAPCLSVPPPSREATGFTTVKQAGTKLVKSVYHISIVPK